MIAIGIITFVLFGGAGAFLLVKGIRQGDEKDAYNTSGKGYVIMAIVFFVFAVGFLVGCSIAQNNLNNMNRDYSYEDDDDDYDYDDDNSYSGSSFTNKFGTSTTKCAVSGCSNYIAKSGDTNCCTTHSNKCLECYCYIDGDAMYCMDCLSDAPDDDDDDDSYGGYGSSHECYICGDSAYSKYGSYYYCSDCLDLVKKYSW